jgi:hypothetical protein
VGPVSTRLRMVVSDELLVRIDAARGVGQSRADWLRRAIEQALPDDGVPEGAVEVARDGTVPATTEHLDDPYREPVEGDRSSKGCPWHPGAGSVLRGGEWICAEPGCGRKGWP